MSHIPKIFLKQNEERRIKSGHLWIFSNEILDTEGDPVNGDLVEVFDSKEAFIGCGFFNKNSLISVRMVDHNRVEDFYSLAKERILNALALRREIYPNRNSFRLLFSESDYMPGLIIDKYNNTYVLQIYSFGMQENIGAVVKILQEELGAKNIFSKNEVNFRQLEGLPLEDEIYLGSINGESINDGAVEYYVDFTSGQKTGFYFDQNDNRFFIENFSKNKTVLDAFCNAGGFGLHAARAGANSVTFIDSSNTEIERAKVNFSLNNFVAQGEFINIDVFIYLESCVVKNKKFDLVIIDPPAFAKNKRSLPAAKKGYEKLNKLAMQIVEPGGYLAASSCSYHLSEEEFISIMINASTKAGRGIQLLHFSGASKDHPELPAMKETSYLKFAVVRLID
jgi:23S rRNA (cytosine1962-C5)-methyltransferase